MRRWPPVLTTRGRAFAAAGLVLVLTGFGLGFVDIARVGVLLTALPAVGLALARQRPAGIRVQRSSDPARVTAGDAATVTLEVSNGGPRSTPLLLAEEHLATLPGPAPRFLLGRLEGGERRVVRYAVRPPLRGRHLLGPLSMQMRDPFGMTQRLVDVGGTGELLVLPQVFSLNAAQPPGMGIGAEGEIPHMVALHGEDDQSIREYRDGDDLRRIHWPATARMAELMVRQEERPARRRAILLLDSRAEGHRGEGPDSSFEWAVAAAASVGIHLSGLGYAVHLICSETVREGGSDLAAEPEAMLHALAVASTGPERLFADVVRAAAGRSGGGGLLVAILTTHDEAVLRRVGTLRQPGTPSLAILLDAASFGGRSGRTASSAAAAATDLLRGAGWTTVVAHRATRVAAAWAAATGSAATARLREPV